MARPSRGGAAVVLARVPVVFLHINRRLPLSWSRALGKWAGRAAYYLVPKIRRVGLANLDLAYGDDLSRNEKQRIVRSASENLGIVAGEFAHVPKLLGEDWEQFVHVEGSEHLTPGQGVVMIGAHLANWEWTPAVLQRYSSGFAAVYRPLDDPVLDAAIDGVRQSGGAITIPKMDAGRHLIRRVKEGMAVGILIDQSPRENAVPIRFFGQPTWGTIAPVMVAARAKAPIHPFGMHRGPEGYTLHIGPEIPQVRTGKPRADLVVNTQRCHDAVEAMIREHPGQWLWFHRRWKPRPRLEAEWQAKLNRDKRR